MTVARVPAGGVTVTVPGDTVTEDCDATGSNRTGATATAGANARKDA